MPLDLSAHDLLRWYLDAGVDETIGEMPVDRYAVSAQAAQARSQAPSQTPARSVAMSPMAASSAPVMAAAMPVAANPSGQTATHLATQCTDLAQLRQALEGFDALALKRTALSTVFADGNPQAEVMCIGEAPGQEEDRRGLPFVGRSGKLLDAMLASIGLDRDRAYITNVVPWRPVDNRKPTAEEVAMCLPFVIRHVELVDPKILILFGGASASAMLGRSEGINRLRGHWHDFSSPGLPRPVPAMPTFHPAYLLRTPAAKREAWRDLLAVRARLGG